MNEMGLLEAVDEIADTVLARRLSGDGKVDMAFRSNASLVFLNLLFLLPSCLRRGVNRCQQNIYHDG